MSENIFISEPFEHNITVENASLTFIGEERANTNKGLPYMYHNHGFAELFFCKKGEFTISFEDGEYKLCEGDIMFIPSGLPHFTVASADAVIFNTGISLKENRGSRNFNAYRKLSRLFYASEPFFFRRYSPIFPDEMVWIEDMSSASLGSSLAAVYTLIRLSEDYKSHIVSEPDKNVGSKKMNIIMQIENYIGGKYYENITAGQLASMLYISPRQLARIVRERFNAPLHQLVVKKRVESAARLLVETNLSVEEISSAVGFSTKSCFYRAFKEEYHKTPLQYKKKWSK